MTVKKRLGYDFYNKDLKSSIFYFICYLQFGFFEQHGVDNIQEKTLEFSNVKITTCQKLETYVC